MGYDTSRLDDYVDVATRITEFRARYPSGYLAPLDTAAPYRIEQVGDRTFVVVVAAAYREPGDASPGVGMAWEPFPGRTPYTRDSELMNAETSAWGRAIIAVGAADARRGIASREEVRNRQDDDATPGSKWMPPANPRTRKATRTRGQLPDDQWTTPGPAEDEPGTSTPDQHRDIAMRLGDRGLTSRDDKIAFCREITDPARLSAGLPAITSSKDLSYAEAVRVLKQTEGASA